MADENNHILVSQQIHSKSSQGMTTQLAKDKQCMGDSSVSYQHHHSRSDSGFLSGANLLSDSNISCDDLSTPVSQKSAPDLDIRSKTSSGLMRLDSGVDVSEQLSCLSLHKETYNDLNCVKNSGSKTDSVYKTNNLENESEVREREQTVQIQPWELYYQQDEDGDTQLHIAIIQGFIEVALSLIRLAPHPSLLDLRNKVSQSPLHLAVLTHQTGLVRRLVVSGADVTRLDRNGNTPLHLACGAGYIDCVRALTEPIAVAEMATAGVRHPGLTRQLPQDLDESNYDGEMCVHLAAKEGYIDILRHLAWFGADLNAREYKSGRTILHYAVENLDENLLQFLLEQTGEGLILDTPTYAGHSAYQLAAALNSGAAPLLLQRGATAMDMDDDDHPDHNAEDSDDDEINSMDVVRAGLVGYPRSMSQVPVQ